MTESNANRLRSVLDEIFMLDRADLDFGIYRIMNVKRGEITRFLNDDLLPQVRSTLEQVGDAQQAQIKAELHEATAQAKQLGADPATLPKVQELLAKYKAGPSVEDLENEVFSHLASFFRRYYKEGDFLSLRRYKEGVYAIPYEGEEVKLHWANADQTTSRAASSSGTTPSSWTTDAASTSSSRPPTPRRTTTSQPKGRSAASSCAERHRLAKKAASSSFASSTGPTRMVASRPILAPWPRRRSWPMKPPRRGAPPSA
jgi:hypothetical protein